MEYAAGVAIAGLGILAAVASGGAAIPIAMYAAGIGVGGLAADICDHDPPDPDYKAIFVPTVPHLPRLRAGNQLTPNAVRALRAVTANHVRYAAYAIAWTRSIEKAQGAAQANDTPWVKRHSAAAARYARIAASALERDHGLRSNVRRELRRAGFRHFDITATQVRNWRRQIAAHGLPSQMESILRDANIDAKGRQALRRELLQVDPTVVAHLGVFGDLDDKRFQQANTGMVKALRQSADSLSVGP